MPQCNYSASWQQMKRLHSHYHGKEFTYIEQTPCSIKHTLKHSPKFGCIQNPGREGDFIVIGQRGCPAGWGRIFMTGLTIMAFNIVTRMGSHIFGILGVRKFWRVLILGIKKMGRYAVHKLLRVREE